MDSDKHDQALNQFLQSTSGNESSPSLSLLARFPSHSSTGLLHLDLHLHLHLHQVLVSSLFDILLINVIQSQHHDCKHSIRSDGRQSLKGFCFFLSFSHLVVIDTVGSFS